MCIDAQNCMVGLSSSERGEIAICSFDDEYLTTRD